MQAAAAVETTTRGLWEQGIAGVRLEPFGQANPLTVRSVLLMSGAVACVLLIAIGNASTLLLADAIRRAGELAVRRSLGATPLILARHLLVEALECGP